MESLIHAITGLGIAAVLLVVYAESGLLIGFVLPGDSLLFTAGYMVNQEILRLFGHPLNIHLFVAAIALMAILGDSTGYAFGHKVGRKLFLKPNSRFFKKKYLEQAEQFYQKHGSLTIVLARFVPIVRTFAPIVAGASKMHYNTSGVRYGPPSSPILAILQAQSLPKLVLILRSQQLSSSLFLLHRWLSMHLSKNRLVISSGISSLCCSVRASERRNNLKYIYLAHSLFCLIRLSNILCYTSCLAASGSSPYI